ncbi:MAG TPA: C40 family peptidase [Gemmatimonadales bacterium]|nr:C40 family peptidase [Gemmatimonadales bacterium]
MRLRTDRFLIVVVAVAATPPLSAQKAGRDLDFLYGRWYQGNQSTSYELRTAVPLAGIFSHGLAAQVLIHDSLGRHRAFYGAGWQLHALRHRSTLGPYAIGGVALGLSTDTTTEELAALWTLGGGVEWRPAPWIGLGLETVYHLQDVGPRGFWRSSPGSRDGFAASLNFSLAISSGSAASTRTSAHQPSRQPPEPPTNITGNAADVVRTALGVLGTPYVWGGTAANGFDCSGLVQWAYSQHGMRLPRTSRDQASAGSLVTPVAEALQPGDILVFAAQPGGGVTHVGLYVGDVTFIHSSNDGVKLSRLEVQDPDGAWWVNRWVGARRIVP